MPNVRICRPRQTRDYRGCLLALLVGVLTFSTASVNAQSVQYLVDVAVSPKGEVYLADRGLPGIWKLADGKPALFYKADRKFGAPLNAIRCLAFDADGKLLAGDSAGRDVYRFGDDGKPVGLTGGKISIPMGIAVDKNGDILVSDLTLQCIYKIPKSGGAPSKVADVPAPTALAMSPDQSLLIVSRNKKAQLFRLAADGKVTTVVEKRPFGFPLGVAVDEQKNIYISDGYGKTIWRIADGQQPTKFSAGPPLVHPSGIALQGKSLLVADARAKALIQIDATGKASAMSFAAPAVKKEPAKKEPAKKEPAGKQE